MKSYGCAGSWRRLNFGRSRGERHSRSWTRPWPTGDKGTLSGVVPGRHASFMNPRVEPLRQVIPAEQIQKRVKELGRQISDDYQGQTIQMLAVLENAFMFLADLVRAVDVPVVCQFIKPRYSRPQEGSAHD